MNGSDRPTLLLPRRLVLGAAVLLALLVSALPRTPAVLAQGTPPAATTQPVAPAAPAPAAPAGAPDAGAQPATPADKGAAAGAGGQTATVTVGPGGITVTKQGKKVRVQRADGDPDLETLKHLSEKAPWFATIAFFSVAMVFGVPLLIVIVFVWYKIRRARMLNETMLKLAEKGVMPPPGAIEALAGGRPDAIAAAMPAAAPMLEQARLLRRRAAWSDLRKGVILGAIGLGLALWGMFDDGTPNGLGVVLLFVGIGYIVLWRFEERQVAPPTPSGGSGPISGA